MTETELPLDLDATVDAVVCGVPEIAPHLADPGGERQRHPDSVRISDNTLDVRLRLTQVCGGTELSLVADAVRAALVDTWPGAAIDVTVENAPPPSRPEFPALALVDDDPVEPGIDAEP